MPQHCLLVQDLESDKNATAEADLPALDRMRCFDRTATLEHVINHLAHELGSPLNVIEGRAAILLASPSADSEVRRNARIIAEQSGRMAQLLRSVVAFCRRARKTPTEVDIVPLAHSAVALLENAALERHASISLARTDAKELLLGDSEALLVLLTHLLENGLEATPPGGTLRVSLRSGPVHDEGHRESSDREICVDVDDDGPEIAPDVLPALFKPFTSLHGTRDASGIGLFVAQAIAKDHGGWIEAVRKPEPGACFTLHLPVAASHAE